MATENKDDLTPDDFPTLNWEQGKYWQPLQELLKHAEEKAQAAITWYFTRKWWRRFFCRLFRLGAILLMAFAGLLPILNQIDNIGSGHIKDLFELHPMWATVAVALAGTFMLIDRFYGFTTGFVRYVLTAQQLTMALESFRLEVERRRLEWASPEPTKDEALALLALIQQFVRQVSQTVIDETKTWAAEFAEVLKQIDEQMRLAEKASRKGAVQLTVTNGELCEAGWTVTCGEYLKQEGRGKTAALQIPSGLHNLKVAGKIKGKPVTAEQVAAVEGDKITQVNVTLS